MITFLHIPKTGCTSIKYAMNGGSNEQLGVFPYLGHDTHLSKLPYNVAFVLRDPWQRFCSGFWERKTTFHRKEISKTRNDLSFGYAQYSKAEKHILDQMPTPEHFFLWAMANADGYTSVKILHEITDSISRWLGNINRFKQLESKITLCFDISNLTKVITDKFGLSMPEDPFLKRSRELFNFEQSYQISDQNLQLFTQWRQADYQLLEYIRQQPYYIKY